jgi:hypothetical protein
MATFNECPRCFVEIPMGADLCASCLEAAGEHAEQRAAGHLTVDEQLRQAAELKR